MQFQLKESVLIPGAVAAAQQTHVTGDLNIPNGSADRTYYLSSFTTTVSGVNLVIGSYVVFRFERIAAAGTAPANDPFVIAVGFHARHNSAGSITAYTK